jgi:hypothetical protein
VRAAAFTLLAEAQAEAETALRRRLAELKDLAPLLAHFEALRPELERQGLKVYPSEIGLHTHVDLGARRRVKQLRLRTAALFSSGLADRWLAALLQLGCTEVRRDEHSITLKRGPLLLVVDRGQRAEDQAASAAGYAVRKAAIAGTTALQQLAAAASAQSRQALAGEAA